MAIVHGPDSNYAKEMRKFEQFPSEWGTAPGNPYVYREFPKRLYKAARVDGKSVIADAQTAHNDLEERNLLSRGFCFGQDKALEALELEERAAGELAAEREYEIRRGRLSDRAVAEVRAAEADHVGGHMPVVPDTPIRRRGRPAKAVAHA